MPLFLASLLLATQGYDPEIEAVMRNREKAKSDTTSASASAAAAATKPLPVPAQFAAPFQTCLDAAAVNPDEGIAFAQKWRIDGGSFYARHCLGFAYAQAERWGLAVIAFEQAAEEAERANNPLESGRLWAQAGNAALAGGDPAKARDDFDAALARGLPDGMEKGEAYLDRGRAQVALNDSVGARESIDNALDQAPRDPLGWLLSATLARRMNNMTQAQSHIARAVQLSPDDAAVALEEGNIAVLTGHEDMARAAWQRAVKLAPMSVAGKAAADNLGRLPPAK